ncbi:hypothetical protein K439DRAFT_775743 [Ramaria rubella]|nr:hypothetical protein K439DRAFT_775743 [Ramaria rubella]
MIPGCIFHSFCIFHTLPTVLPTLQICSEVLQNNPKWDGFLGLALRVWDIRNIGLLNQFQPVYRLPAAIFIFSAILNRANCHKESDSSLSVSTVPFARGVKKSIVQGSEVVASLRDSLSRTFGTYLVQVCLPVHQMKLNLPLLRSLKSLQLHSSQNHS